MRNFRLVAGLLALVVVFVQASSAAAVLVTVADYQDDFQAAPVFQPTTTPGWQYLWNANGAIGNSANYANMLSTGSYYTPTGGPIPTPGDNYAYLALNNGHPGPGVAQSATQDRYVIAAYTIQASDVTDFLSTSNFQLTNTSINDNDTSGETLDLRVYVNNILQGSAVTLPGNTAAISTFNRSLGDLVVGDTVYVAVGPNGSHNNDGFGAFDFTIQFDAEPLPPAPEPSTALLLGAGLLGLSIARRRATRHQQNPLN